MFYVFTRVVSCENAERAGRDRTPPVPGDGGPEGPPFTAYCC
ncbi:hypothetical protein BDW27_12018 [Nocardiopsis sp. L17-MgMaSL7]|nr:hypothetical protein BDW27_12018 [Nocardiopsis sp. L17-MgMaSL7]